MTTTVEGAVSVRAVAKTFASGKTEKLVYQTLAECDMPCGKVRRGEGEAIGERRQAVRVNPEVEDTREARRRGVPPFFSLSRLSLSSLLVLKFSLTAL